MSRPNVLIILDNTSNWAAQNQKWEDPTNNSFYDTCRTNIANFGSQQGDAEVCALYRVMTGKVKDTNGNDTAVDDLTVRWDYGDGPGWTAAATSTLWEKAEWGNQNSWNF